jgi:hypothetical protein
MKYLLEVTSRPLYPGPEARSFSELQQLTLLAQFADDAENDNDFQVGVQSDYARCVESASYFPNQQYMGSLSVAGQVAVRNNVQIVPQVSVYGSFFQYFFSRKCPVDGNFSFLGANGEAAPMNVDQEFIAGLGTVTGAT